MHLVAELWGKVKPMLLGCKSIGVATGATDMLAA